MSFSSATVPHSRGGDKASTAPREAPTHDLCFPSRPFKSLFLLCSRYTSPPVIFPTPIIMLPTGARELDPPCPSAKDWNDGEDLDKLDIGDNVGVVVTHTNVKGSVAIEPPYLPHSHGKKEKERSQHSCSSRFRLSDAKIEMHCASSMLRELDFPGMTSRRDTITAANSETFQWVFKSHVDNDSHINHWLLTGDRFFWVTGSAGSGKSTLMNFLVTSPETKIALSKWAGNAGVVVVSYFFWNSGKPLQKSFIGLLRASVYQILENDRHMVKILEQTLHKSRGSSKACVSFREIIASESHLCQALLAMLDHGQSRSSSYCFFIDAPGECEGDRTVLLDFLQRLVERPHIKVCASSTPWPSLKAFFTSSPTMNLQGLTLSDLSIYAGERIRQQSAQVRTGIADSNVEKLISDIVTRSNGIFLWVVLVTREVCEGLARGDKFDKVQSRLDASPIELRDLLTVMLERCFDASQRVSAKDHLSLRAASSEPMDLLTFSMACLANSGAPEQDALMSMSINDAQPMVEEIASMLSTRTAGLLEVSYNASESRNGVRHPIFRLMFYDVGFLHDSIRTVVKNSLAQNVVHSRRLFKAAVRIGSWIRSDEQAYTRSAYANHQEVQLTKSIIQLDSEQHS